MLLYRSLTVARIYEILVDSTPFTAIVPAARRAQGDAEGWLKEIILRGASDFPQFIVGIGDNFNITPFKIETFNQEPADFDPATEDFDAESAAEFKLQFVYRDLKQATDAFRDELEMKALAPLIDEGPTLGLPYVRNWRWSPVRWGKAKYLTSKGTEHPVTEATMLATYLIDGQSLLPDPES